MLRLLVVAFVAIALSGNVSGGLIGPGTVQNKFMVKWNVLPDPFGAFGFYEMPRTVAEAEKDHFAQAAVRSSDKTTVWCRKGDYRVCVLFDQQGSVAGIQVAVDKAELTKAGNAPLNLLSIPEWRLDTLLGKEVFVNTVFFVSKDVLLAGGRTLDKDTLTAPEGIYLLQTDEQGNETGRQHVSTNQSEAEQAGFYEQACFIGMGKHYFQNLKKDSQCEDHRPFFTLYGPKTSKLNGFGFVQYGKPSSASRGWFESPPAVAAKMIAPNSPDCQSPWINKYGLFTMHVFFIERPYFTMC